MNNVAKLGAAGLRVSKLGLGCMGMSEFYGASDEKQSLSVLHRAHEIGCRFWDTSDIYGPLTNERLLGQALKGIRSEIVVATKFGIVRDERGAWLGTSGRPEYVRACCEASLKRLNTDYIDLYYQHRMDPSVPIEDTIGELSLLVAEGKVRYIGLSEADPDTIRRAHRTHPVSALQTEYSLWSREVESAILPCVRELGIGFVSYSPLGRGFLGGEIQRPSDLQDSDWRRSNPRFQADALAANMSVVNVIKELAERKSVTPAQIALAWILAQGEDICAIPGTKRQSRLEENWSAQSIRLDPVEVENLSNAVAGIEVVGSRY